MKDFDLRKFLIENKLTSNSRLNEDREVEFGDRVEYKGRTVTVGKVLSPDRLVVVTTNAQGDFERQEIDKKELDEPVTLKMREEPKPEPKPEPTPEPEPKPKRSPSGEKPVAREKIDEPYFIEVASRDAQAAIDFIKEEDLLNRAEEASGVYKIKVYGKNIYASESRLAIEVISDELLGERDTIEIIDYEHGGMTPYDYYDGKKKFYVYTNDVELVDFFRTELGIKLKTGHDDEFYGSGFFELSYDDVEKIEKWGADVDYEEGKIEYRYY